VRTLRGWRGELAGHQLLELLDGRVSLSIRERRVRVIRDGQPPMSGSGPAI